MSYKFIIDTNVLDEKSSEQLREGGILQACNSGRFAFYATPVLLTERMRFVSKGVVPVPAIKPLRLLFELKWQRLFNEPGSPDGICAAELEGKSQNKYLFSDHRPVKENLDRILNGDELTASAKQEIDAYFGRWAEKKENNREQYKLMRADFVEKLRQDKSLSRKGSNFKAFLPLQFEPTAIEKIKKGINSKIPADQMVEYWTKHRERCPYFNKFIEGWLFTAWYFMAVDPDPAIDINAHEDVEHLIYLTGLEGIVSNEKGFMRAACKALFPNKDFLTTEQFVARLKT